jgi:predicted ATPase/DNA-binding winged helix-turn-helix (wHTH) protein
MNLTAAQPETLSFGDFILLPGARTLTRDGSPVDVGGRGLDLLIALLRRPNVIIGKRELMSHVWPDVVVDESSLRFHIANLRKALGEGLNGARYIATVTGRGYCFVAPVSRSGARESADVTQAPARSRVDLPGRTLRIVGRTDEIQQAKTQLLEGRFVTIVGSGGVGKTTVAVALAHELAAEFAGSVLFVDLGAIQGGLLIAVTIASMLGLSVQNEDAERAIIARLQDRRMLLVLDTCEHLIEGVAALSARLAANCPQLWLLATSREALRADGEQVFILPSLACPPDGLEATLEQVLTFPAAQLFVERARASGTRAELKESDAPLIAGICRKLDGVALAIELAAGRVQTYGLRRTAELLDEHLSLSWPGRRTAPPRQRTLQATLDWSYELLLPDERSVLRRLSVFIGYFTFEAALQVATTAQINEDRVYCALESLIDKSLISVSPTGAMMRYRLLDTTRAYALQTFDSEAERAEPAARHALYFCDLLSRFGTEWPQMTRAFDRAPHLAALGNARAALEWCFGPWGDSDLGVGLAAAAMPVFLGMSLLTEAHLWAERALACLSEERRGGVEEMRLQSGLAMSLMFIRDHGDAAHDAFMRSLAIAVERGDTLSEMLLLGPLHMFHFRRAEFRKSLEYARRSAAAAELANDPQARAVAQCLIGISLHSMGELAAARTTLETSLRHDPLSYRNRVLLLGFDYYIWAGMALGRTLWMQGDTKKAIARIRASVDSAERLDHPVTLSMALHWAAGVYLWAGELDAAEIHIDWFLARAETHSLGPYLAVAQGLKGELAIRRGAVVEGVDMLARSLSRLQAARYELVSTSLRLALVEGLLALERLSDALELVGQTLQAMQSQGDLCFMAELLRNKGLILRRMGDHIGARACLEQSLEWSERQSAQGWTRRAQADLADLEHIPAGAPH